MKRGLKKEFIQWNESSLSNLMNIEIQHKMQYREMIKKDGVIRLSVHWHVTFCRVRRKRAAEIQVFQSKMKSLLLKYFFYIIVIQMFLTKSNTQYISKKNVLKVFYLYVYQILI